MNKKYYDIETIKKQKFVMIKREEYEKLQQQLHYQIRHQICEKIREKMKNLNGKYDRYQRVVDNGWTVNYVDWLSLMIILDQIEKGEENGI